MTLYLAPIVEGHGEQLCLASLLHLGSGRNGWRRGNCSESFPQALQET